MRAKQKCLLAAATLAICIPFAPAHAALTLTAAGTSAGFTLDNFLSGGSSYTFLGSANLPDGTIAVGGFAGGQIYKFNDVNNQTLANALASTSFSNVIDLANAGGQAYAASRSSNLGFVQISNNLTLTPIATNPNATPTQGLAGNPVSGNLIATTNIGLVNLNPITGSNTFIVNTPSLGDGVSVSPDGTTAYVAIFGGAAVRGYNILNGLETFAATGLPGGPDGTAVIVGGAFNGSIIVNNNDGSVGLLDVNTAIETIIASGGTRGDFASPDLNNGSLFVFQDDSVWRLSLPGSVIGGPAAVPEPETYAMLLAGLGLLGFAARRRKQQAT
ncbi:MAG: PEP-CTERM sorting domain-containing protein [Burkholderiales bacterium]